MKYALFILILFSFITISSIEAKARSITSLRQSGAISTVVEFMYDIGEDVQNSIFLTDKKMNVKDFSKCTIVSSEDILDDVNSSIKKIVRFYPDEEIPFEEALADLQDYLDFQTYKKCTFVKKKSQSLVKSTYYVSSDDKIHLRLDNTTLTVE